MTFMDKKSNYPGWFVSSYFFPQQTANIGQYLLQIFAIPFQKMQTYANYIPLFLKRLCSTRSDFFFLNLPQQQPQPAVSFNCRQVMFRFRRKKNELPCSRHAWKPRQKWPSTPPRSRYRPSFDGAVFRCLEFRGQGDPMRQTHSMAAKSRKCIMYILMYMCVRVSLEGANFKESIIIYYPYLAIPKPLKLWQQAPKTHHLQSASFPSSSWKNSQLPEAEKPNLLLHRPAWIHGYSAGPRSWNLLQTEPTVGPRGSTERPGSWGVFFA